MHPIDDAGVAGNDLACGKPPRGKAALQALTTAALLLPGLACTNAHAETEDGLALQFGHYREGTRAIVGAPNTLRPLASDTLRARSTIGLPGGNGLTLSYAQDTWSGATPITTAPVSAKGNRPVQTGGVGALITVGASPMINGQVLLDGKDRPVVIDPASGKPVAAPAVVHTLSSASPETRQQLDAKFTRRLDDGAFTLGGGVSMERDYRSRFVNVGQRFDLNEQLSTLTLGLSRTRSDTAAALDHEAAPYITKTAFLDRIDNVNGKQVLRGRRDDWAASLGFTQVLGRSALLETHVDYTRSAGDLANPYKLTSVIFAPPTHAPGADGMRTGNLQALLEQRPALRKQMSAGVKLIVHHAPLDGALHLGYGHFRDDWGISAHRVAAEWFQPLGEGWTLSPRLRYYTQSAARFYTPYLVSRQPYRQVSIDSNGQPLITVFNPGLLPAHFSSDQRLSAFGSVGAGVGLSRRIARNISLDVAIDYARYSGALKAGGGGEGRYADLKSAVANAALSIDFGGINDSRPHAPAEASSAPNPRHDAAHAQAAFIVPPGVQFAHLVDKPGAAMLGYRQWILRDAGSMRHGSTRVDDGELMTQACPGTRCSVRPQRTTQRMQMLELMFGLSDRLSLMLMPQYMSMAMDSRLIAGAAPSDTALHFGRHESGGPGDTQVHALFKLRDEPAQRWVLGLGLSAPTGDTELRHRRIHQQDAMAMAYDMQTGSGTWDGLPSLSVLAQAGRWSAGAQVAATLRLQSRNPQGYALGDRWQASGWLAYRLTPQLAASVRGAYGVEGAIKGERNDPHAMASPPDFPGNYGGRFGDIGLGLTLNGLTGAYRGTALGLEVLLPVRSRVNGYQLAPSSSLALNWSHHF